MTKEKFLELVNKLSQEDIDALVEGINQVTFEYGWGEGNEALENSEFIKSCWKKA